MGPVRKVRGRPLKWETPEDMEKAIQEYFEKTPEDELTVTGLALAIGTNKQCLINYEKREDYRDIVRNAKGIVENSYEMALRKQGGAGNIFALKNFGWRDKQDIEFDDKRPLKGVKEEDLKAAARKLYEEIMANEV